MSTKPSTKAWKVANAERVRESNRAYVAANPEKVAEFRAKYAERHPERIKASRRAASTRYAKKHPDRVALCRWRRDLQNKYGLTPYDYESILAMQGNRCAICESSDPGAGNVKFAVDHCHDLNIVRGLICTKCNLTLGQYGDDPESFRRMADYLEIHRDYWTRKRIVGGI